MLFDGKPITNKEAMTNFKLNKDVLKKLGIRNYVSERKFKNIDEIFKSDTGMVLGKMVDDNSISVNNGPPVHLNKNNVYVMTLNMFTDLYRPKNKSVKRTIEPNSKSYSEIFSRYRGQNLDNKKLFVSRTGGLGDLVVSQSVLNAIKSKFPTCSITYATTPAFKSLFNCFPKNLVETVIDIPYNYKVIDTHDYHMLFIHAIENCTDTQKQNYLEVFRDVSCLDYDPKQYMPKLFTHEKLIKELRMLGAVKPNTIALHISSTTPLRVMKPENWIAIIKILLDKGYNVGILESSNNDSIVNKWILECRLDTGRVYSLAKYSHSIAHGINILSLCKASITIDSSFSHISAALDLPNSTICGPYPSYNVVGFYKYSKGIDIPEGWNNCGKAPCFYNSQHHLCPYIVGGVEPECQSVIKPETIVEGLFEMIDKKQKDVDTQ